MRSSSIGSSCSSFAFSSSSSALSRSCPPRRDERPERAALVAVDPVDRVLVALEAEDRGEQLLAEARCVELRGDEVHARDRDPRAPGRGRSPTRSRTSRSCARSSSPSPARPSRAARRRPSRPRRTRRPRCGLKTSARRPRVQPELDLERHRRRREREQPVVGGLLQLRPAEAGRAATTARPGGPSRGRSPPARSSRFSSGGWSMNSSAVALDASSG